MNLPKGIINVTNSNFNNPCITYDEILKYLMDYINEYKPRLYMSKSIIDKEIYIPPRLKYIGYKSL